MVGLKQPLHNRVLPTSACHSRYFMCVCSCHSKFIISDYVGIHTRINSLNTASCLIYIYTHFSDVSALRLLLLLLVMGGAG